MTAKRRARWAIVATLALLAGCDQPTDRAQPTDEAQPTEQAQPTDHPQHRGVDCAVLRCVALTFDDGPVGTTSELLDALSAADAPATLYVRGSHAQARPEIVRRAHAMGLQIGNHTWSHRDLTALSPAEAEHEVQATARLVAEITGEPPTTLRPPFGRYDEGTRALGPLVLWDVNPQDWRHRSSARTVATVEDEVRRGSVVLLHDTEPSTVAAVPTIIDRLRARGYTLVRVDDLIGAPRTGTVYRSGERHD